MALAQVNPRIQERCSIGKQLMLDECEYFSALGKAQTGTPDITAYLVWFLGCIDRAVRGAIDLSRSYQNIQNFSHP
jgi:hypothetical protein